MRQRPHAAQRVAGGAAPTYKRDRNPAPAEIGERRRGPIAELAACLGKRGRDLRRRRAGRLAVGGGSRRSHTPPPPEEPRPGEQGGDGHGHGHSQDGCLPIGAAARHRVGIVEKGCEIGRARYCPDFDQALLNPAPAFRVRMAERDVGIAGELACDLRLVAREAGRVGYRYLHRQLGEDARRDLVGMLQGIRPTLDRGRAKALHHRRIGLRQTLQREQAVAVELGAIARGVEGSQRNAPLTRLPGQLPGRADHRVDPVAGEVGNGLARLDRQRSELLRIDPFAIERGAQLEVEDVARRQPPDSAAEQRLGRGEIAVGAVIDHRAALLKDRRQQQQRLALGRANQQLNGSRPELGAALRYFADRIDRARTGRGSLGHARLDLDLEPRLPVKALPQRGVVAGKLELRLAVELENELVRRTRRSRDRRQRERDAGSANGR